MIQLSVTASFPSEGSNRIMCLDTLAAPGCREASNTVTVKPVVGVPGGIMWL